MKPEHLIELKCPNCGSALLPEDISPQLAAARCDHCKALFAIPQAGHQVIARPDVPLPKGFSDPDQALFVEQQIERHLKIADTPVAGEYGR